MGFLYSFILDVVKLFGGPGVVSSFLLAFFLSYLALSFVGFKNKILIFFISIMFAYYASQSNFFVKSVEELIPKLGFFLFVLGVFLFISVTILGWKGFREFTKQWKIIILTILLIIFVPLFAPELRPITWRTGIVIGNIFIPWDVVILGGFAIFTTLILWGFVLSEESEDKFDKFIEALKKLGGGR